MAPNHRRSRPCLVPGLAPAAAGRIDRSLHAFTTQGSTREIELQDVATTSPSAGIDNSTPTGSTHRDPALRRPPAASIVFKRSLPTISSRRVDRVLDSANLPPVPGLSRTLRHPRRGEAIGGTTVAFEQKTSSTLARNICVASIADPTAPATCLTDSLMNRDPAVSPDGTTVVWSKCTGLLSGCDIWAVSKSAAGGWNAPRALTTARRQRHLPRHRRHAGHLGRQPRRRLGHYFQNLDGTGLSNRLGWRTAAAARRRTPTSPTPASPSSGAPRSASRRTSTSMTPARRRCSCSPAHRRTRS